MMLIFIVMSVLKSRVMAPAGSGPDLLDWAMDDQWVPSILPLLFELQPVRAAQTTTRTSPRAQAASRMGAPGSEGGRQGGDAEVVFFEAQEARGRRTQPPPFPFPFSAFILTFPTAGDHSLRPLRILLVLLALMPGPTSAAPARTEFKSGDRLL